MYTHTYIHTYIYIYMQLYIHNTLAKTLRRRACQRRGLVARRRRWLDAMAAATVLINLNVSFV